MAKTLFILGLMAAAALGQSVGHDLIVSEIDGINYYGAVGGVSAFAFGATVLGMPAPCRAARASRRGTS